MKILIPIDIKQAIIEGADVLKDSVLVDFDVSTLTLEQRRLLAQWPVVDGVLRLDRQPDKEDCSNVMATYVAAEYHQPVIGVVVQVAADNVEKVILRFLDAVFQYNIDNANKAAKMATSVRTSVCEWLALPPRDRVTDTGQDERFLGYADTMEEAGQLDVPGYAEAREASKVLAERRRKEIQEAREWNSKLRQREYAEKVEAETRERNAWIEAHGSGRLKWHLREGVECQAIYRDERLAHDLPNWTWMGDGWTKDEPRNVSEEAIEALKVARKEIDAANGSALVYIQELEGWVTVGRFLGRNIARDIIFRDGEVLSFNVAEHEYNATAEDGSW